MTFSHLQATEADALPVRIGDVARGARVQGEDHVKLFLGVPSGKLT